MPKEIEITLRKPHSEQSRFIDSPAKRKVIRAGRRGGKTVGVSILALEAFLKGRRVLYAAPTIDQVDRFWFEVTTALGPAVDAGVFVKNESKHLIEKPRTEQRIRAKTAWNADTLRGDYADLLILDEFQMMNEDAWELVGAPMMLDTNGDTVFIYTPPSIRTLGRSKAKDPKYAAKLYKRGQSDRTGRWVAFHFSSHKNPHLSLVALEEITQDMSSFSYSQEILALDSEENPRAMWKKEWIENNRVTDCPELDIIVIGVDPAITSDGDEHGIVAAGVARVQGKLHGYVLSDISQHGSPAEWAAAVVKEYNRLQVNRVVAESNQGGEMVANTILTVEGGKNVRVFLVQATRGKQTRAEPVSALYERNLVHHVGQLPALEYEMVQWEPGMKSPNRMDALVWALTDLLVGKTQATPKDWLAAMEKEQAEIAGAGQSPALPPEVQSIGVQQAPNPFKRG